MTRRFIRWPDAVACGLVRSRWAYYRLAKVRPDLFVRASERRLLLDVERFELAATLPREAAAVVGT